MENSAIFWLTRTLLRGNIAGTRYLQLSGFFIQGITESFTKNRPPSVVRNAGKSTVFAQKGPPITTTVQRIALKLLSQILKSVCVLARSLGAVPKLFIALSRQVVRLLLRIGLLRLYTMYLNSKRSLQGVWRPAKNKALFVFSTRYVAHSVLIIITLFVASNSLAAREIRKEEQVKPSLLFSLIGGMDNKEVVETADGLFTKPKHTTYGIGGVSPADIVDVSGTESTAIATQDSSTIVNPLLASTDTAATPRTDIVHHAVNGGETLGVIAQQYGISTNTIRWANSITGDLIKPGQDLVIPPVSGVVYKVASGDTVSSIAKKYKADADAIVTFNKLASAEAISEGQTLVLPDGEVPAPVAPVPTPTSHVGSRYAYGGSTYSNTPPPSAPSTGSGLLWPGLSHRINQYMNWHHTGVDIDGDTGNPIYAAAAGKVTAAGWGNGYGIHVVIDHGNGMQTLYGHASKLYVKVGDYVNRGQTIAAIGCTGRCTGPHIHFEVRIGGGFRNPLSYTH